MRPLDRVLERLEGVKAHNGYFMALCPAHDDRNPSLSITEGDDGRVLLKCFADCIFDDVVVAIGLEAQDFFPEEAGGGEFYSPRNRENRETRGLHPQGVLCEQAAIGQIPQDVGRL